MRAGGSQLDICIRNVSVRGMLILTNNPPPRGTYVEILRNRSPIVGRVVWAKERRCGILTSDRLDVDAIVAGEAWASPAPLPSAAANDEARATSPAAVRRKLERSRFLASALQFFVLVSVGAVTASMLGSSVYQHLSHSFGQVATTLESAGTVSAGTPTGVSR